MKSGPGNYAGVVSRGIAFGLDASVAVVVCTVGFEFTRAVLASVRVFEIADGGGGTVGYLVALPLVFATYCAAFWALVGRTPGMMLLGLRVVTIDGGPLGLGRAIVRAVGYWISAIAFIGFAWIAIDKRSQGFHDKLAGTCVVYDWDTQPAAITPTDSRETSRSTPARP